MTKHQKRLETPAECFDALNDALDLVKAVQAARIRNVLTFADTPEKARSVRGGPVGIQAMDSLLAEANSSIVGASKLFGFG